MELHSPMVTRKLWNYLRLVFFMMRKGLISKRKLIMDMNLVMQRGKFMSKTLANLMFHHHHPHQVTSPPIGMMDYEFSCRNTPNPIFLRMTTKRKSSYFPCIHATPTIDEIGESGRRQSIMLPAMAAMLSPLSVGERRTPVRSPFTEDEAGDGHIDVDAEEFIRKFYERLRLQSSIALLQGTPERA